jgi:HPt (histidine-containing phosphotransfer) domain-containing protein
METARTNGSPSDEGHVNWQQALETLDGNRQLLIELVAIFREECPKLRAQIELGLKTSDLPLLRRAAHTLKGALAHLAANRARATAETIEDKARLQNLQGASELWLRLQAELDQLSPILEEFAKQPCG